MRTERLKEIVFKETFPLFNGKIFVRLKLHIENSEDEAEATRLVVNDLVSLYSVIAAEQILLIENLNEDLDAHNITFNNQQRMMIEEYAAKAVYLYRQIDDLERYQVQERYATLIRNYHLRKKAKLTEIARKHDRNAFFNEPDADADWEHWNTRVTWEPSEAVALSFGKDPRVVNEASLAAYMSPAGSLFRGEYLGRLDNIKRSISAKMISTPFLQKGTLAAWLNQSKIEIPLELKSSSKSLVDSIHGNTLHKLYGIVLGLAIKKYHYDVLNNQEHGQRKIVDDIIVDLGSVGFEITYTTLNRYFEQAKRWASQDISHPLMKHAYQRRGLGGKGGRSPS